MPSTDIGRKRNLRRIVIEELLEDLLGQEIPSVGQYDNYEGIRGAGPLAGGGEGGGFAHSERGLIPGGAGPSETGSFLNL